MNFLDTHFHLDLFQNADQIASQINDARIYTIAVTNTPSVFHFTQSLERKYPYIRAALGLHPQLALERAAEIPLMWDLINETKYIGEIGLDYGKLTEDQKVAQRRIFDQIISKCAELGGKVLSVHSRGCAEDVISAIGPQFPGKVILHWYSGTIKQLELAISNGFYFSVNHQMTLSENGRKIISKIPIDRILTETDGPFVVINSVDATPLEIPATVIAIGKLLEIPFEQIKQNIFHNFKSLLVERFS